MNATPQTRYALSVDHLVLAGPDLEEAVGIVEAALGVELQPGGSHPGLGTRNRLLGLGSGAYLEVIGPDPDQPEPIAPRPFGIDALEEPTLVTWALRVDAPEETGAEVPGYEPFRAMSRRRPDGTTLSWKLAFPTEASAVEGPVQPVPFLIDWGAVAPPGSVLAEAATLEALHLSGPAEVAAAVHVVSRSPSGASEGPTVDVRFDRGKPRLEAALQVEGRQVVWSGAIGSAASP